MGGVKFILVEYFPPEILTKFGCISELNFQIRRFLSQIWNLAETEIINTETLSKRPI